MKPFTFEELQKILELNAEEIETDILIFNATLSFIESLLGYQLDDKNYNELHTVKVVNQQTSCLRVLLGNELFHCKPNRSKSKNAYHDHAYGKHSQTFRFQT